MSLTQEQIRELKAQLLQQTKDLPSDQKAEAEKQIESMSPAALETMLRQQQAAQAKIFRKIADKEIPSKIVDENNEAIAVLEIRPISKGHTIVIPKKAVAQTKELPENVINFSKDLAKKLGSALSAKRIELQSSIQLGEVIVNLIPIYDKELNLNSQREEASDEDLEKTLNQIKSFRKIETQERKPAKKVRKRKPSVRKIKRRIP